MSKNIEGATIAITGGTGSFGSNMARNLLIKGVAELRIISRDEAKQDALRHELSDSRVRFYIGDTRDFDSIHRALKNVDHVFHAAALKQVPSAEFFPLEAVKTNVNGSANVIRSAIANEAKSVVCLSTDKAVYPINAMGMTKALMEKTAQAFAREYQDLPTVIATTRYGNVMHSRGSVIPLFISQIMAGKKLTITAPQMTRFLMSLDESVDLVEYAFSAANTGDLLVRKAPASTIQDLAIAIIQLFNGSMDQIEIIGFRHGEKLYESLLSAEEALIARDAGAYYVVPMDNRDLNYSVFFEQGSVRETDVEAYTSHNTSRLDVEGVKELLLALPEVRRALELWKS